MIASRRAWIRVAVAAAAAASLGVTGGCSLSKPAPVKEMFVLEPASPPAAAKAQPGVLRIGTVTVGASFRGRGFVYREADLKYESDYYREFLVAPAANIGEATAYSPRVAPLCCVWRKAVTMSQGTRDAVSTGSQDQ